MKNKGKIKALLIGAILGVSVAGAFTTDAYAYSYSNNGFRSINRAGVNRISSQPVVHNKQEFYNVLKGALERFETNISIRVANYNNKDYDLEIANKIVIENPSINYGYTGMSGSIYGYARSNEKILNLNISYRTDRNTMIREKAEVQRKVQSILSAVIKPGMSDVEKELALHDYVVKNADYNVANYRAGIVTAEDHNAYGVLVNEKGVCESYAKAMYELLTAAGVQCKYVTGYSNQGGGHAWNMVKLENEWYNLDSTWDDPISDRNISSGSQSMVPVSHKYFNVPDSIFNRDHRRGDLERTYPACNGTRYSFENLNVNEYTGDGKLFVNVNNVQELDRAILRALVNHEDALCLKVKGAKINLNQLLNRMQVIARNNRIYGFGMNASSSDSYIRVNLNW